ncbi:MAG: prolyl oligopeptidase family serine peptidase [Bacteroidales bacterium]|nr:prolyl oligopeptidase family serine peptidase [Bacteroidales bacterium]
MGRHTLARYLCLLILSAAMVQAGNAQQRTGNIVEIFGRTKVESTGEGVIIHQFTDGFALRDAMRPGMLTGTQDILFWQLVNDRFRQPYDGKVLSDNYADHARPLQWERIEADAHGYFRGNLQRAYVYTEFESPVEQAALLEATGHTRVFINGMPAEGDHYDYGHTLIPFTLQEGLNQFIYTYGRFGRVASKIVIPHKELQFSSRDMTLPSLIPGETGDSWGAVRVINASGHYRDGLTITCVLNTGETASFATDHLMPLAVRKLKFRIPGLQHIPVSDKLDATLFLQDAAGVVADTLNIVLNVHDAGRHHERTFISAVDGSVQYYSLAPSLSDTPGQALVLSVHGASVEAVNQARAYAQKDWAHIVAPTNRRPFGFNWEEWGRLDALEVLHQARSLLSTDTARTYLTGHSMGGHGTWFLGATYPCKWAAIAPAAGYADIIGYRRSGTDSLMRDYPHYQMIYRGARAGRTLDLAQNFGQSGVYVLHGDADAVVPVEQARQMRSILGEFHGNFAYYEYPGGTHWYGDHSMDWPPLFDFLKQNTIPTINDVKHIRFKTVSPGVSATNYWLRINQQQQHYEISTADFKWTEDTLRGTTKNIESITLLISEIDIKKDPVLFVDGQKIYAVADQDVSLKLNDGLWHVVPGPDRYEKHPGRYGGFKLAFTNNVMFVYATRGTHEETRWYRNKARFDAETFLYRGNSSVDVMADTLFSPGAYPERNVILYGNAENNAAWKLLLDEADIRVYNDHILFGNSRIEGDDLGALFVYPRPGSQTAAVGVVAGTGHKGMKALYANDYFSGITGFPDVLIVSDDWIKEGMKGIRISGFFGNDWSVESGDFIISNE